MSRLPHLLALLALVPAGPRVAADPVSLAPYESDVAFLSNTIAEQSWRLKRSEKGEALLSDLGSGLRDCQSSLQRMKGLAGDLAGKEEHIHYLAEMELDPKQRAIERLRENFSRAMDDWERRAAPLDAEGRAHNEKPHVFSKDDVAGLNAYNAEAADLDRRIEAMKGEEAELQDRFRKDLDAAVLAHKKAQEELVQAEGERDALRDALKGEAGQYRELRAGMTERFKQVEALFKGDTPLGVPPLGPGSNPHALDQLRVVTAASRAAAQTIGEAAKSNAGYGWDTESPLPADALPDVAVPEQVVVVPLEVAPPETGRPAKGSEPMSKFEREQAEDLAKLDRLYQQRRELAQQRAEASPEAWTQVVSRIAEAQAHLNFITVVQRLNKGSTLMNLDIVPKTQSKPPAPAAPPP